ncbi:exocyst complex component Sec3-domain-containing protein [Pisolithus croceorrhizus]|nr:exocyst complex component Sec3-domain-containing protein [Pisolithus croceorrhizus]
MADNDHTRQRIISSVFDKRNAGASVQESYVAHVKIWEDTGEGQGKKPRYILLSRASDSTGFVHKSKLNTNGSFSVGKTWRLAELRGIEVVNPTFFNITLGRTYKWQAENPVDQSAFIHALIDLFRSLVGGHLQLQGVNDPAVSTLPANRGTHQRGSNVSSQSLPASDVPTTGKQTPLPITSVTSPLSQVSHERAQTPLSQSPARSYLVNPPSRSASPADLLPGPMSHVAATQITASYRSPSPTTAQQHQQPQTALPSPLRPRVMRRPSNAVPPLSAPATGASHPSSLVPSRQPMSNPSSRHSQESVSNIRPSLDLPQGHSPLSAYPPTAALPPPRVESPALTHSVSRAEAPKTPGTPHARREHSNRVSFFDPANQAAIGRLVAGDLGEEEDTEVGQETSQATMLSVEEMLEGYDWASDDMFDRKSTRGAADLVEARLLDELTALEKANIHSFLESDDRVHLVTKYLDEALSEVDAIDSLLSSYKIHLNAVGDDISFIQSQRRGLQVHTQNQRALLNELENLLQTVQVSDEALHTLAQESLEKPSGIQRLEEAATELYKALQASQDTEMAATMERLDEYRTYNTQFCKRLLDYLSIMVVAKAKTISEGSNGVSRENARARPTLVNHGSMETYLGRYAGLVLYLKEMDEAAYSKLCAAYFSAASDLHGKQMRTILSIYSGSIKKYSEEDSEQSFAVAGNVKAGAIRRAGTIIRSPIESQKRDRDKRRDDDYQVSEAFGYILEEIAPLINQEGYFIADFLQINDAGLTFADYTGLENYFRRQAARSAGLSQSTTKLVRGAMDLIFGFLPQEIKQWVETAIAKDTLQVVGVIVCLERFLSEAEERGNTFFLQMLDKQHLRLKGTFDRHVNQQIKMVEETKLTSKKRKGVAHFIKYFPVYVHRVEQQLVGADGLDIRTSVDLAYERIVHSMFECLKHMATLDGDGEDKGQLNYHVLLVENMHYFVAEMSQLGVNSVTGFLKQAEAMYNESLNAYVKIVLKRPFAKLIASSVHSAFDFFEGVERLLKTTAPSEVQKNSSYNKSALKRVLKEFDGKDVRKHIDVLFRRVEKHFTEAEENTTREESSGITPGTVMVGVWKACEEELQRMTENFNAKLSQCYSESGLSLEYSSSDVDAAFKRHNT